jgi:tRNA(Arg) A34 adenosine deaminase TadA
MGDDSSIPHGLLYANNDVDVLTIISLCVLCAFAVIISGFPSVL